MATNRQTDHSEWVQDEVAMGLKLGKRLIPVLASGDEESIALLRRIKPTPVIDVRDQQELEVEQIVEALKQDCLPLSASS